MKISKTQCPLAIITAVMAVGLFGGCASTPHNPDDPFESFNRGVYQFNDTADKAVIKPVATAYHAVVPKPVRTGVSNFFSNLDDVVVVFNDVLQFKLKQAVSDSARVIFNSTFGILGLIDIASDAGIPKHNEDFGQTLGYWGFNSGPFLMLPLFGPSSFRDGIGLAVDYRLDPIRQIGDIPTRNKTYVAKNVSIRSDALDVEKVFEEAALDPYAFLRDAYVQRRRDQVYDGNPPRNANGKKNNSRLDDDVEIVSEIAPKSEPEIAAPAAAEQTPTLTVKLDTQPLPARSEASEKMTPAEEEATVHVSATAVNAAAMQAPQVVKFWFSN